METLFIIIAIIIIFVMLCNKQESYYNVIGQYIDGPADDTDGINESAPNYSLSRIPNYWWWNNGIPFATVYDKYLPLSAVY